MFILNVWFWFVLMMLIWLERKVIGVFIVIYIMFFKLFVFLCFIFIGFFIVLVLGVLEGFGNNNYILGFVRIEVIVIFYF